jgi:Tol biopolymer transport system component
MKTVRIALVSLGLALATIARVPAAPSFSAWSAPVNLGPLVNSASDDYGGALSKDGLSLYFTSTRPGGFGGEDLWISQRASEDDPFGLPVNLGSVVNTGSADRTPALTRDGHWLLFASNRSGGFGGLDVWASYRENTHDDFGWEAPVNLGPGINTATTDDTGPTFLEGTDGHADRMYFARGAAGVNGGTDIYVSELGSDGTWGDAQPVPELSSPVADAGPEIRFDGREIIFHSTRPGSAATDLWSATRESPDDPFLPPVNLGPLVNGATIDRDACLSSKGDVMILSSDRPGGFGSRDLYVSTRTRPSGK